MSGGSRELSQALTLSRAAAHGLVAGAVAGAVTGAIEAALAWGDASHFLFTAAGKLRFIAFLAALYGSAGAVAGAAGGVVVAALLRHTAPGAWLAAAAFRHRQARERDPREALTWLALVLAGVPLVLGCLAATYAIAHEVLAPRRHPGLVIAAARGASLAALAAAALATAVAVKPVELGLRALARRPALGRALSSPLAPPIASVALVAAAGLGAALVTWETIALLSLAPGLVALAIAALTVAAARLCRPLVDRLLARSPAWRRSALAALPIALALITIAAGAPAGARKTANHYTALGDPLLRAYRAGFALAGGDGPLSGDCAPFGPGGSGAAGDPPCPGADELARLLRAGPDFAEIPAPIPERPNIVLITIDTLRHDHVGAYGYERDTTPHMDRVADEGALFENSWAHAPSTRYSMPAILTGRYPLGVAYDHSVRGWPGLGEDNTTIAEVARSAGYRTAAFTNHWYFDRMRRMDQGFDVYDNANARLHKNVPGAGPAETTGSSSRQQTDVALDFLDRHLAETERDPFLLWVHYYDPHYVYTKHPEVPDFGDGRKDLYDSEIAFTDHHIGRLLDRIRDEALWDDTAVVIASDHGEGFGEKGIDLHGYHLYAPQTRVPLIVRVPGAEPRRVAMPVGHVDILPTIANLVGAEPRPDMVGRSLLGVITGQRPADEERWIFQQLSFENNNEIRGAANRQCHVIYNISPHTSWELYRIDTDPAEARDVIGKPGPCAGGPELLAAWTRYSQIPGDADEALLEARPDIADPLDVEFGPQARLLAVDLPDEPVRRGESFEVTYTFEAGGSIDDDWKIFVHVASDGGGYFQGDHEPARPFSWWRAGDVIRYSRAIRVPRDAKTGTYDVWMGMFRGNERRAATSHRVEVSDKRARVGEVTVR